MSLARPRASSLSIPIPTTALWRLYRPPTPRRATFPLPANYDTPPVPPLSFRDPETPSPAPTNSPAPTSPGLSTPTASSYYSQPNNPSPPPHVEHSPGPPKPKAPLLQPILPDLPNSPRSTILSTSPQSPHNPFLSPPTPRWNAMALFTLASPLLPASPLSVFDHAVSPTSPTFLLSRTPSPVTPDWAAYTFLRSATPSVVEGESEIGREEGEYEEGGIGTGKGRWKRKDEDEGDECISSSPTFLYPRTAPSVPLAIRPPRVAVGDVHGLQRGYTSTISPRILPRSAEPDDTSDPAPSQKNMKLAFLHHLAARRASALQSEPTPHASPTKRRLAQWIDKYVSRFTDEESQCARRRRGRFSVWKDLVARR